MTNFSFGRTDGRTDGQKGVTTITENQKKLISTFSSGEIKTKIKNKAFPSEVGLRWVICIVVAKGLVYPCLFVFRYNREFS